MKTKYTFEKEDFDGRGQVLIRQNSDPKAPSSYLYKVGYTQNLRGERSMLALISLQDGQTLTYESMESFLSDINDSDMRPATKTELFQAINNEGNRFLQP